MIKHLGWGTFLLWGIFDAIIAVMAFFFLKETKGLSLEAIAHQQFKKDASAEDIIHTKNLDEADVPEHRP